MQKKIIVLAVVAAIAAPVAMAEEVVIYGQANMSYDMLDNGGASGTSANKISSNASRIGFKGAEDLGGGTSAIWQIESSATIDDSTTAAGFASRPSFAGLSSESWGSLVMGNVDSPAKVASNRFDQFKDTRGDSKSMINYVSLNNAVVYSSPSMSGFKLSAAYSAAAENASLSTNTKGSTYSLAVTYDSGPLKTSLAYDKTQYGSVGTGTAAITSNGTLVVDETVSYTTLGAGYTVDALTGNIAYQRVSDSLNTRNRNTWMISGKYSFGSDAVKLQYVKTGELNSAVNTGASQVGIGYDHSMSKNTTLYALYTKLTNDSGTKSYKVDGANALAANGDDSSGWSIGMKHSF